MALYSTLLIDELLEQRRSELYCDVTLRIGHHPPLKAHACVLVAASDFFQDILSQSLVKDINLLDTKLSNVCKVETLQKLLPALLEAIYTGKVPSLETKDDCALFKALGFKHLKPPPSVVVSDEEPIGPQMEVSFCSKCHILFTSMEEFLEHRSQSCIRKLTCRTCGKMFSKVQSLLQHLLEAKHGELICSVCNYISESSPKDLESHIKTHALVPDKPYFCLQCESRFSSRKTLVHHLPKHSLETPHVCHVCTKGFKWKHSLTSHMVTHSPVKKYQCEECGYLTSHASTFKFHSRVHSGDMLQCPVMGCSFQTVRKQNFIQHSKTHDKDKPYQCEFCGKAFSLSKNMRRHKATYHGSNTPAFSCNLCGYKTPRSDKFTDHLRRNHPEEKDRLIAEKIKSKENQKVIPELSTFNHIFEPISSSQKMLSDSDIFVESAEVVSSLTDNIDNVLLANNL